MMIVLVMKIFDADCNGFDDDAESDDVI